MAAPFGPKNVGETPGFAHMLQTGHAVAHTAGAQANSALIGGEQKHPDYLSAALQAAAADRLSRPNATYDGLTVFAVGLLAIGAANQK